jgi:hypothetical protein
LASLGPGDALLGAVRRVLSRRGDTQEPVLPLEALDALAAVGPLDRLRLLSPLVQRLERRKVKARAEEILEAAVAEAELTPQERGEVTARTGGAEPDGWVRVALEDGGETRSRIGADGAIERDGEAPCAIDARAIESAERKLLETWEEYAGRLERALVTGRSWRVSLWREIFAGHPLLADLAKRLTWETGSQAFVWTEGGAVDLFGDPVALDGRIGLLHPIRLDADELELWREHARDRDGPAPFAQLFRDVLPAGDDPLAPFVGREVYADAVAVMAHQGGWTGCPLRGVGPWRVDRELRADLWVSVVFDEAKAPLRGTLYKQKKKKSAPPRRDDRRRVAVAAVEVEGELAADPLGVAEVVRDLERLTDPENTVTGLFLRAWQQRKWRDKTEAWREVVLAYRKGSPARLQIRRELIAAVVAAEGLDVRLEDRFAITGTWVIELGTGLCHEGVEKDHLPTWKVDELAAEGNADRPPLRFPFRREAEEDTVVVVERVIGLARRKDAPSAGN